MNLNKTVHFELPNPDSTSCMKESIVEIGTEGGNHLTIINDYEEWGDDSDLQGLISTRNSFSLVSRLWTIYIFLSLIHI